jgi:hypothetical protein
MVEPARELFRASSAVRLDVRSDHRGEYFHLMVDPLRVVAISLVDVRPVERYLMLSVRQRVFGEMREAPRRIFVCGRQGRSLFVRDISIHPVPGMLRPRSARPALALEPRRAASAVRPVAADPRNEPQRRAHIRQVVPGVVRKSPRPRPRP